MSEKAEWRARQEAKRAAQAGSLTQSYDCDLYGHTYNSVEPRRCIWCERPK